MKLNPFIFLFESKHYPHARSLRTTLKQKVKDCFYVFFGELNLKTVKPLRAGLFDYFTLFITWPFIWLRKKGLESPSLTIISTILNGVPLLVRLIFCTLATLVSFPIICLVHTITSLIASSLWEQALQLEGIYEEGTRPPPFIPPETFCKPFEYPFDDLDEQVKQQQLLFINNPFFNPAIKTSQKMTLGEFLEKKQIPIKNLGSDYYQNKISFFDHKSELSRSKWATKFTLNIDNKIKPILELNLAESLTKIPECA